MPRKLLNEELGRVSPTDFALQSKVPIVLVLDNIRSRHNIGAAFRTADAFAIQEIILCGICAQPPDAEIHKSALGAENSVKWRYFTNTLEAMTALKAENYTLLAVEQTEDSTLLHELSIHPNAKYALVFGNEVRGVAQNVVDVCDGVVEIPQYGTKHSLNISVSVGVVLWEVCQKLRLTI
ncbi:MAG: RNA methyltransferase [Bacteroidales bacterium]